MAAICSTIQVRTDLDHTEVPDPYSLITINLINTVYALIAIQAIESLHEDDLKDDQVRHSFAENPRKALRLFDLQGHNMRLFKKTSTELIFISTFRPPEYGRNRNCDGFEIPRLSGKETLSYLKKIGAELPTSDEVFYARKKFNVPLHLPVWVSDHEDSNVLSCTDFGSNSPGTYNLPKDYKHGQDTPTFYVKMRIPLTTDKQD